VNPTPGLEALVALEPPGPGRIHLHLPGFRPGRKERSQDNAPLCGVFVHRGLNQVRLDVARLWTHVRPTWAGSEMTGERYWCPPCLGRLVVLLDIQDHLVGLVVAKLVPANQRDGLTPHAAMGNVGHAGGETQSSMGTESGTPPAPGT